MFNLETAVGRTRWCVWVGDCREATRRQAGACNEERQRQAHAQTYQRVRSALTKMVKVIEGKKVNIHAAFLEFKSGQLRFLGSTAAAGLDRLETSQDPARGVIVHISI